MKIGDVVQSGTGGGMVIGTITNISEPVAPYFITWVSLNDVVKKDGTPSKKYKNGTLVQMNGLQLVKSL